MKRCFIAFEVKRGKTVSLVPCEHPLFDGVEFVNESEAVQKVDDFKRENPKAKLPCDVVLLPVITF